MSNIPIFAQQKELNVISYSQSKCQNVDFGCTLQPRIIEQTLSGDTLKTIIGIISNCSGISRPIAYLLGDTLYLQYTRGTIETNTDANGEISIVRSSSRCDCCFEFTFFSSGINKLPSTTFDHYKEIKFHPYKYRVTPIQFNIYQGDTVNYVDKFGRKQGKWLTTTENDIQYSFDSINFTGYYINNYLKQCDLKTYYKNGKIKFEKKQTDYGYFNSTEYDEDGTIKEKIISSGDWENIFRIHYFRNGNIKMISTSDTLCIYYEKGQLKKKAFLKSREDDLKYIYYYDNGKIMAKCFNTRKDYHNIYKWRCFNKTGRRISLKKLVKQGYLTKKDIAS